MKLLRNPLIYVFSVVFLFLLVCGPKKNAHATQDTDQETIQLLEKAYQKFLILPEENRLEFLKVFNMGEPFLSMHLVHLHAFIPEDYWNNPFHLAPLQYPLRLTGYYRFPNGTIFRAIDAKLQVDSSGKKTMSMGWLLSFDNPTTCLAMGHSSLFLKVMDHQAISVSGFTQSTHLIRSTQNQNLSPLDQKSLAFICSKAGDLQAGNSGGTMLVDLWFAFKPQVITGNSGFTDYMLSKMGMEDPKKMPPS